eukprot:905692-Prorocentrum_minimum.AAC.1
MEKDPDSRKALAGGALPQTLAIEGANSDTMYTAPPQARLAVRHAMAAISLAVDFPTSPVQISRRDVAFRGRANTGKVFLERVLQCPLSKTQTRTEFLRSVLSRSFKFDVLSYPVCEFFTLTTNEK